MKIILFIVACIISFTLAYFIHYLPHINDNNEQNTKKLILTWNSKKYHIHHWITFSLIIIILLLGKFSPDWLIIFFIGLCLGTIFEDFLFDDIFKIEISND